MFLNYITGLWTYSELSKLLSDGGKIHPPLVDQLIPISRCREKIIGWFWKEDWTVTVWHFSVGKMEEWERISWGKYEEEREKLLKVNYNVSSGTVGDLLAVSKIIFESRELSKAPVGWTTGVNFQKEWRRLLGLEEWAPKVGQLHVSKCCQLCWERVEWRIKK